MFAGYASFSTHARPFFVLVLTLIVILAACGGDDSDEATDTATDSTPATTSDDMSDDQSAQPDESDEPAEDVDLAPELSGLTDWRNTDPVSLEDLRGEPVVLVFWNSI